MSLPPLATAHIHGEARSTQTTHRDICCTSTAVKRKIKNKPDFSSPDSRRMSHKGTQHFLKQQAMKNYAKTRFLELFS